jgi:hypothetical protein
MAKLLEHKLQAKLEKCEFHVHQVEFLGYIISEKGIAMDPKKVKVIVEWATPTSAQDIHVFIGFSNFYRRFVKNFSGEAKPMTRLLKKNTPFQWDDKADIAFKHLKTAFASEPVLAHFKLDVPCYLEPDASKDGIGAVFSQPNEDGILHPVAYYSRALSPPERNYHVHDTELLAVVEGLENWRHYFAYSKTPVTVLTDHKNLEYFTEKRNLNERQIRWAERLSKYNIQMVYRPGSSNGAADALSRMHSPEGGECALPPALLPKFKTLKSISLNAIEIVPQSDLTEKIKLAYQNDTTLRLMIEEKTEDPSAHPKFALEDGLIFFQGLIFVPPDDEIRREILSLCHDDPRAGHFGIHKTYELVVRTYYWHGLRTYVKDFVNSCDNCQRNKQNRHKPYGLLQPLPIPQAPWSSISMDFITQLPVSNGYTSIFVVVDRLTKMAHFIPTHDEIDAEGTVALFMNRIVTLHGLPDDIVSDRGSVFTAQFTRAFMEALNVTQNLSTAYHPQSDGQTERTNATLEQYLRCYSNYHQDNWSSLLPLAEFCYNNTVHSSTNHTPFYALYGYHPRFNVHIPRVKKNTPEAEHRLAVLKQVQEDLQFYVGLAQESQAKFHDRHALPAPNFVPGDKVWLVRKHIRTTRPSDKLDSYKLGPFKILAAVGTRAFRLELPAQMSNLHPVFNVSLLEPYIENTIDGRVIPPPPPVEIEGELEYEVEAILDSRYRYKQLQYLVHWKGYSAGSRTWEPAIELTNCQELIREFHQQYPDKPSPIVSRSEIAPKRGELSRTRRSSYGK